MLHYVATFVSGVLLALLVVGYFVRHIDKWERLWALIVRGGSFLSERHKRRRIALDVQSRINTACERLNAEMPGVLPHALKIQWATRVDTDSFLRNHEVIVRMSRDPNDDANTVRATMAYLSRGLLPEARLYPKEELMRATDFVVSRKILSQRRSSSALNYFYENVWGPYVRRQPSIRDYATQLEVIDNDCLFTRIYLRELKCLGERVRMRAPDPKIATEIDSFVNYLQNIAARERGEESDLPFIARNIRVHIILVAKLDTIEHAGIQAHENRLVQALAEGADTVYLLASGQQNVMLTRGLARRARSKNIANVERTTSYQLPPLTGGRVNPAVCIVCQRASAQDHRPAPKVDSNILEQTSECFDEIANREIEVRATAIEHETVAKIAVAAASKDFDVKLWCQDAHRDQRHDTLLKLIGVEQLDFIPWSNDACELAVAALFPLHPLAVDDVWEESGSGEIWLQIEDAMARGMAIGKSGCNIKVANRLVARRLMLAPTSESTAPEETSLRSHAVDQIVVAAMREHIPEFAQGKIEVLRTGYVPSERCKIAVRAVIPAVNAVGACIGESGARARAVQGALNVLRVDFLHWDPDPLKMLVTALHPLDPEKIVAVEEDPTTGNVRVLVSPDQDVGAIIGTRGCNIRATERLTNTRIQIDVSDAHVGDISLPIA